MAVLIPPLTPHPPRALARPAGSWLADICRVAAGWRLVHTYGVIPPTHGSGVVADKRLIVFDVTNATEAQLASGMGVVWRRLRYRHQLWGAGHAPPWCLSPHFPRFDFSFWYTQGSGNMRRDFLLPALPSAHVRSGVPWELAVAEGLLRPQAPPPRGVGAAAAEEGWLPPTVASLFDTHSWPSEAFELSRGVPTAVRLYHIKATPAWAAPPPGRSSKAPSATGAYWHVVDEDGTDLGMPPIVLRRWRAPAAGRDAPSAACGSARDGARVPTSLPTPDEGAWLLHAPMLLQVSKYGRKPRRGVDGGRGVDGSGGSDGSGEAAASVLSRCVTTYYSDSDSYSYSKGGARAAAGKASSAAAGASPLAAAALESLAARLADSPAALEDDVLSAAFPGAVGPRDVADHREAMPLLWCLTQAATTALSGHRGLEVGMPMQLLVQLEILDALADSHRPEAVASHRGGASDSAEPVASSSSTSSTSPSSSATSDDTCAQAEAQPAPTALLQVVSTPLVRLTASDGAPVTRVLQAIRDGRVARWLRPLWNPRTFGARVEIAQEWVDRNGVAALFPCSWALQAIPYALQPEACRLLDEASTKEIDWWQALEMKAAAAALALSVPDDVQADWRRQSKDSPRLAACEPWCASEPCSALNGDPKSILLECGGCDATHTAGCWPGAADFPKMSS